jgi:hypothetical protein
MGELPGRPEIALAADKERRERVDRGDDHPEALVHDAHRLHRSRRLDHRPAAGPESCKDAGGITNEVGPLAIFASRSSPKRLSVFIWFGERSSDCEAEGF